MPIKGLYCELKGRSMNGLSNKTSSNRCYFFFLFHFLCCLPVLVSCQQEHPAESPIRIGIIAYLQGDLVEAEGRPTENAARMALRDFEASGGLMINGQKKKIELIVEGINQSKEAAVSATRKLINRDGVVAIVGPQYSSDAIPAGSIAEISRVPMISPGSTSPATTKDRNFVFRMSFLDPVQGAAMAKLALIDLGASKAAVLFDESDEYSRGIAEVFQSKFSVKGKIVAVEKYIPGDPDLKEKLIRIRLANPDVLFLPGFHSQVVTQDALARELGIKAIFLGADGWDQREVAKLAGFDDTYFSLHWSPLIQSDNAVAFSEKYREEFSSAPNGSAALTYDATQLILHALQQQQKISPESLRNGLIDLPAYPGVAGEVDFVDSGDPEKDVVILHVKDGSNRYFKSVKSTTDSSAG